jgi:patatin-like phospholipase/acyl hydrolase
MTRYSSTIQREPTPRFRVLSLDGGGIRGVFTAAVLAGLEEASGKRVAQHFDLIVGTSTGGIIALALGLGLSASEALEFYELHGPKIFPSASFADRLLGRFRHLFLAKHSREPLRAALAETFGNRRLGDSKCRLVIPAFDAAAGDVHLFKTAHHPALTRDYLDTAVDVALATSAAPTYLPGFTGKDGRRFVDGGVWANTPATAGILEAMVVLGQPRESIEVLSIGTTETPFDLPERTTRSGVLGHALQIANLLMHAQAKAALAQALLLTEHDRMLRINPLTQPGRFSLDDCRGIGDLKALGSYAARHASPAVIARFLDEPAAPFIPERTLYP